MSLILSLPAGGLSGWVDFRFIGANAGCGLLTSIVIGICGAYLGSSVLLALLGDMTLRRFNV